MPNTERVVPPIGRAADSRDEEHKEQRGADNAQETGDEQERSRHEVEEPDAADDEPDEDGDDASTIEMSLDDLMDMIEYRLESILSEMHDVVSAACGDVDKCNEVSIDAIDFDNEDDLKRLFDKFTEQVDNIRREDDLSHSVSQMRTTFVGRVNDGPTLLARTVVLLPCFTYM